jgi:hypothetical protein
MKTAFLSVLPLLFSPALADRLPPLVDLVAAKYGDSMKIEEVKKDVLTLIARDGIEAAEKKYLSVSTNWNTRQLSREIFGNLEQNTITGEWFFRK